MFDKIKNVFKSPVAKSILITGGIVLTKIAAFYIYKEMKKEDIIIDI